MAEQLDISLAERQRCATEFWPFIHQAYGDDVMGRAAVFKWWKHFRDGETNVKDEPGQEISGWWRGQNCLFDYSPQACDKRS
jgi:hypothetical protein